MNLSKEGYSIVLSSLNNVLGYPMGDNIETEVGVNKETVSSLHDKVIKNQGYQVNNDEAKIIIRCLDACLKHIDAWEFNAIFEYDKETVEAFYKKFKETYI